MARSAAASRSAAAGPRRLRASPAPGADAPAGAPALDRLIHERLRLAILSALSVNEALSFSELKALLRTSDGNLSVHARKLEEGGYLLARRHRGGPSPRTEYRLSPAGRRALQRYLDHMEALIRAVRRR